MGHRDIYQEAIAIIQAKDHGLDQEVEMEMKWSDKY